MSTENLIENRTSRDVGLAVRRAAIDYFTSASFGQVLGEVLRDDTLAQQVELPAEIDRKAIQLDMATDQPWVEEFWKIHADQDVTIHMSEEFFSFAHSERFSNSDCLRRPRADAYALRGLLSALVSDEVSEAFGRIFGSGRVSFMTADTARYRPGHYLRRHDDVFDGRIFGLVFFLHESWEKSAGTRLIAEHPDGRAVVVEPLPATVAVMRLANGYFHQVEQNFSSGWTRYSIAAHFGIKDA